MKTIKTVLFVAGLTLVLVGAGILFTPHSFYASNGTELGHAPSLLSEVRASGALLLGLGVVLFMAVYRETMRRPALILSALVFLAYGGARLASMMLDGLPSMSLVIATGIELLIGGLCVWAMRGLTDRAPQREGNVS